MLVLLLDQNYSDIINLFLGLALLVLAAGIGGLLWGAYRATRRALAQQALGLGHTMVWWLLVVVLWLLAAGLLLVALDLKYDFLGFY